MISDSKIFLDNEDSGFIFLNIAYPSKLGIKLIILLNVQAEYFLKVLLTPFAEFFHLVLSEFIIFQYYSQNVLELLLPLDVIEGILGDWSNGNSALLECPINQGEGEFFISLVSDGLEDARLVQSDQSSQLIGIESDASVMNFGSDCDQILRLLGESTNNDKSFTSDHLLSLLFGKWSQSGLLEVLYPGSHRLEGTLAFIGEASSSRV